MNKSKKSTAEGTDKKRRKALKIVVAAFLFMTAAAVCIALYFALGLINSIQYDDPEKGVISDADVMSVQEDEAIQGAVLSEEESEELYNSISALLTDENDLVYQDNVTNILLIGTDGRYSGGNVRADAIILLSVNSNTKQLVMTSIMRDTAVVIGKRGYPDKLTHSYAYGGAALLIKTIQANLGIRIDKYVAIDFYSFVDAVDYLGGIEMDVSESERNVMNRYVREINHYLKLDKDDGILNESGENILLTGKQTLGYVRNRYSHGTADFGRTQRQRDVLEKIIQKVDKLDIFELYGLLNITAPNIVTDYTKTEMLAEVLNIPEYSDYEIVQSRIPADDTWYYATVGGASLVCYDFETNKKEMLKTIYGTEMPQESEAAQ